MKIQQNEKWILCGASRGLGKSFLEIAQKNSVEAISISRKSAVVADFTQKEKWPEIIEQIREMNPTRLFYFAGGGPHGPYAEKQWKDHEWAYKLNFEFPAFLLHSLWKDENIQQLTFVGSSIAESNADPGAASYAAAKHALKGLVSSLQGEKNLNVDLRLFSPGYMDTQLLPANAWPRQQANLVKDTRVVAQTLWDWIQNADDAQKHLS